MKEGINISWTDGLSVGCKKRIFCSGTICRTMVNEEPMMTATLSLFTFTDAPSINRQLTTCSLFCFAFHYPALSVRPLQSSLLTEFFLHVDQNGRWPRVSNRRPHYTDEIFCHRPSLLYSEQALKQLTEIRFRFQFVAKKHPAYPNSHIYV